MLSFYNPHTIVGPQKGILLSNTEQSELERRASEITQMYLVRKTVGLQNEVKVS
jgi:hypothetical protein